MFLLRRLVALALSYTFIADHVHGELRAPWSPKDSSGVIDDDG